MWEGVAPALLDGEVGFGEKELGDFCVEEIAEERGDDTETIHEVFDEGVETAEGGVQA